MSDAALRILVMADTHNRLPPHLEKLAVGVNEIWHLGDMCQETLRDEIAALGVPLQLVRGNCDAVSAWPLTIDLKRHGVRFRLQHIPPDRPVAEDYDVLLHGHTHVPRNEMVADVRMLNPGCVTRPNRGAPASLAFLEISREGELKWTLQRLR